MNIPEELLDNDLLFHFTKSYVAMESILYEKRIRFSSLINMNDPYEYKIVSLGISTWGGIPYETASEAIYRLRETILYKSKILSIVRSKESNIVDNYHLVFAKPRLWAQYAEAQYGVCLVFSLSAFLDKLKKTYPQLTVYDDYVEYDLSKGQESSKTYLREYDTSLSIDENIKTHIEINKKDIFFRKYEDFKDESEYRLVLMDWKDVNNSDIYIDIEGLIIGVIIGERFRDVYEEAIKYLAMDKLKTNLYRISYDASYVALKKF